MRSTRPAPEVCSGRTTEVRSHQSGSLRGSPRLIEPSRTCRGFRGKAIARPQMTSAESTKEAVSSRRQRGSRHRSLTATTVASPRNTCRIAAAVACGSTEMVPHAGESPRAAAQIRADGGATHPRIEAGNGRSCSEARAAAASGRRESLAGAAAKRAQVATAHATATSSAAPTDGGVPPRATGPSTAHPPKRAMAHSPAEARVALTSRGAAGWCPET